MQLGIAGISRQKNLLQFLKKQLTLEKINYHEGSSFL